MTAGGLPKVCAVVLNVADTPELQECLRSLDGALYGNLEIIVVRNGPFSGRFEQETRAVSAKVSDVVFTGFNSGFAAGNNAGIRRALEKGCDYVLLLNDDAVAAPDCPGILLREAEKDPGAGMLGPEVLDQKDRERVSFSGAEFDRRSGIFSFPRSGEMSRPGAAPFESDYVSGCALLARKSLLEKVGPLDERYFLYWEDSDWGFRAKKAGFRSMIVPAARVWHKLSSSAGADSPIKVYHKTRGRLLFAETHFPAARKRVLLGELRDVLWLLFRSAAPGAFRLAAARLAGIAGYLFRDTGAGPGWLRR